MHSNPELKRKLFEQSSSVETVNPSVDQTAMEKEIKALEELKLELEKTKKELELKNQVVGGRLIDRIKNYFKIRKIRKENQTLETQITQLEKDFKDLESGKILTDSQKKEIIASITQIIVGIGGIFMYIKTLKKED